MIENQTLFLDQLEEGVHYKNCTFKQKNKVIHASANYFEHCQFQTIHFQNSEWLDCQFKNISFSNCDFFEAVFYRCHFQTCLLVGTLFQKNRWKDSSINESKANYASFAESHLENCQFLNTQLNESFFQEITVKKTLIFDRCEINEIDFIQTKLQNIDLSTSTFDTLRIQPELIKGLTINTLQATQLISLFGVQVK